MKKLLVTRESICLQPMRELMKSKSTGRYDVSNKEKLLRQKKLLRRAEASF